MAIRYNKEVIVLIDTGAVVKSSIVSTVNEGLTLYVTYNNIIEQNSTSVLVA